MKLLTSLLLMTLTLPAHAETFFYSRNDAGGAIVLSVNKGQCMFGLHGVVLNMKGEAVYNLCWEVEGTDVHVVFSDGDKRTYKTGQFTKSEYTPEDLSI